MVKNESKRSAAVCESGPNRHKGAGSRWSRPGKEKTANYKIVYVLGLLEGVEPLDFRQQWRAHNSQALGLLCSLPLRIRSVCKCNHLLRIHDWDLQFPNPRANEYEESPFFSQVCSLLPCFLRHVQKALWNDGLRARSLQSGNKIPCPVRLGILEKTGKWRTLLTWCLTKN